MVLHIQFFFCPQNHHMKNLPGGKRFGRLVAKCQYMHTNEQTMAKRTAIIFDFFPHSPNIIQINLNAQIEWE